jgi:hypothetical protein
MSTLYDRLDHCNHEIKKAGAENKRLHTEAERFGILIWEMDKRSQRASILVEIATQRQTIWERL